MRACLPDIGFGKDTRAFLVIARRHMATRSHTINVNLPRNAGFVFLPSCLSVPEQADLVTACLHETTTTATRSNLDTHYVAPPSGWWAEYVKSPDTVIQPRSREACGSNNDTNRFPEVRVQVDLPEMNQENFEKETCGTSLQDLEHIGKADPPPGENIVATPLHRLIRKLRWTIIGLEYHVSMYPSILPELSTYRSLPAYLPT